MGMFNEYATKEDLASYMGKTIDTLPNGVEILIKRASELVSMSMLDNYNSSDSEHVELAKLATCAQCQNWIDNELGATTDKNISSYSLGELSITYSDADKTSFKLCTTATRYLNHKFLLYKGLG